MNTGGEARAMAAAWSTRVRVVIAAGLNDH